MEYSAAIWKTAGFSRFVLSPAEARSDQSRMRRGPVFRCLWDGCLSRPTDCERYEYDCEQEELARQRRAMADTRQPPRLLLLESHTGREPSLCARSPGMMPRTSCPGLTIQRANSNHAG